MLVVASVGNNNAEGCGKSDVDEVAKRALKKAKLGADKGRQRSKHLSGDRRAEGDQFWEFFDESGRWKSRRVKRRQGARKRGRKSKRKVGRKMGDILSVRQ